MKLVIEICVCLQSLIRMNRFCKYNFCIRAQIKNPFKMFNYTAATDGVNTSFRINSLTIKETAVLQ